MSHLLRIALPDVPGSLGVVASALGAAGANIEAIEIVEHRADGTAIDDVFLEFNNGVMPDMVVSAVQRIEGVRVLWVSRYAAGGNLHLDLEAIEVITNDPARAIHHLTHLVPRAFRSDWAQVAEHLDGRLVRVEATVNAPDLHDEVRSWFPVDRAERPFVDETWEGWSATEVAVAPLGHAHRIVIFGRHGGPEILDSELARLDHIAGLTASIESSLDGVSAESTSGGPPPLDEAPIAAVD
jgi:hypothetical protein